MGIKNSSCHSTVDKDSLHVKFGDEAVCTERLPVVTHTSIFRILCGGCRDHHTPMRDPSRKLRVSLAENARFAEICGEHNNIKFINLYTQPDPSWVIRSPPKKLHDPRWCTCGTRWGRIADFDQLNHWHVKRLSHHSESYCWWWW